MIFSLPSTPARRFCACLEAPSLPPRRARFCRSESARATQRRHGIVPSTSRVSPVTSPVQSRLGGVRNPSYAAPTRDKSHEKSARDSARASVVGRLRRAARLRACVSSPRAGASAKRSEREQARNDRRLRCYEQHRARTGAGEYTLAKAQHGPPARLGRQRVSDRDREPARFRVARRDPAGAADGRGHRRASLVSSFGCIIRGARSPGILAE
jgi:hypothetical protein